ncbi:DUF58 domain-containing protein [Herbiconiux moechotypicola]|uniref:DUF58 domain-containing protein n=1 Tax=Herbiconiux moechotypicola TaxID=637393 RepID=A0ABP5Q0U0_9MICO|nr:DUF58 domain-containing protein [Herbiconiux moechotypicola]MCS5728517.1 DUF58 domain-containing protein [Herbiconiux moechotypicola]
MPGTSRGSTLARAGLPRLTLRGWGLVAAAVVAFVLTQVLRRQELAYLAVLLLAVPALSFAWVWLRRLPLGVARRFEPETASLGRPAVTTLFVQNWSPVRTPAAAWSDGAPPPLRSAAPAVLPPLPGFTASRFDEPVPVALRYRVDTGVRGEHPIGPLVVTVTDPFGCAVRRYRIGTPDTLLVTPTVFELSRIDVRLSTGDGSDQVSRRLVGSGEQDVIARKYLPGDSIRRVHWPATAKHGELMVRQDDQRNDQDAVVLLDAASFAAGPDVRARARDEGADARFEWAVSATASIALHLVSEGYGVRAVGHSAMIDDEVVTAPHGTARLLRDLARTSPEALADAAEFREAVDRASLTSPDAPPLFAVVADAAGAADRIRELAGLSSHPVVLVVSDGDGAAAGAVGGVARVSPTATTLRRAGWSAVDCTAADSLTAVWRALGQSRGIR